MEGAHADFNLRELPCYLSNTYEILLLSLKFIGEQDFVKIVCQGYNLLPWQPDFRCHTWIKNSAPKYIFRKNRKTLISILPLTLCMLISPLQSEWG